MDDEDVADRYKRLCREYEDKFGEPFANMVALPSYTDAACDLIERCIKRGTPCNYTTDIGLTPEQAKEVVF
ncbi:MAG: 2-oxo-4-hydroxy-4-carboxy-5-ureidoimidazoline decarboxylase [Bifidobacterium pseudolongum]|nr:2-oxo-4-hydroxy-4-carboxy-5-ureidoimidazoline decarboxylase [Bifidobacterium pseudolongum]